MSALSRAQSPLVTRNYNDASATAMVPEALQHTSARLLEFDSLRDLLRGYAVSALGQTRITALAPSRDRAFIDWQQQLTAEVRAYWKTGARFDFAGLSD